MDDWGNSVCAPPKRDRSTFAGGTGIPGFAGIVQPPLPSTDVTETPIVTVVPTTNVVETPIVTVVPRTMATVCGVCASLLKLKKGKVSDPNAGGIGQTTMRVDELVCRQPFCKGTAESQNRRRCYWCGLPGVRFDRNILKYVCIDTAKCTKRQSELANPPLSDIGLSTDIA